MNRKTTASLCIIFFTLLVLSSCAPNESTSHEYGFFGGIIHGLVLFPFALLSKLFGMDYGLYADNNSGLFYWLGYIIGLGGLGGGGAASRRS
ncbi:hypothetical protein [Mucilaginibacter sp.]